MDRANEPKSLPHKHGVVALIEDGAGRLLLIRRGWNIARAPGVWCFVGGEVETGETREQAIEREVLEEVGLTVTAREKIHESISPGGEFLLHWMRVSLPDGAQELKLHAQEVAEARWLTRQEAVLQEPMLPALKAWLKAQCENP
jgi:8-oxo-dGTP pyrophosphatase MutT (NUDIX family)